MIDEHVTAVVALGSNLGKREAILGSAVDALRTLPETTVEALSTWHPSVAETLEGPDSDRPEYLNGVAILHTRLDPFALLNALRAIERQYGRDRSAAAERWGDRTLDLDLITHGDAVVVSAELTIPHERAHERAFVLEPWLEADADAELPGRGRVAELLAALGDADVEADPNPDGAP